MQLIVHGKNFHITPEVQAYVQKRANRVERHLERLTEIKVELGIEKTKSLDHRCVAQITTTLDGIIFRGEKRGPDILAAFDEVLDVLDRRLMRHKEKLHQKHRGQGLKAVLTEEAGVEKVEIPYVARRKVVALKPLTEEQAAEQMELLGHDFFLFLNAETEQVNVIYRRRDDNYGLIEAELPK